MREFFSPYKDSALAHILEVIEYLALMFLLLWISTGVSSGSSEYDIVDFTYKLGVLGLIVKLADLVMFLQSPKKSLSSPIQTIGLGNGWRVFWGLVIGVVSITILSGGSNLSFFSTFLQFSSTYMFWFLVFIGPRIEEIFSNVLHPTITAILNRQFKMAYPVAGMIALLFVVAPLFAGFHWFTYYNKSGAQMSVLIPMLFAAYVYRCIFTLGNYVLKTDEYGKWAHMTHNFIGYWIAIDNPFNILPAEQVFLIMMVFGVMGLYFVSLIIHRAGKYGLKGLLPDTFLAGE